MVTEPASQGHRLQGAVAQQHAEVRRLFAEAHDAPVEGRGAALGRLVRLLAIHEAAEQVALHGRGVRDLAEHANLSQDRVSEEEAAAAVIVRLVDLDPASANFRVQLGLLEEAVERHADAEETQELPALLRVLSDSDASQAADAMTAVAELAAEEGADARVPSGVSFEGQHAAARRLFEGRAAAGSA